MYIAPANPSPPLHPSGVTCFCFLVNLLQFEPMTLTCTFFEIAHVTPLG
jgi:hypothetical protein